MAFISHGRAGARPAVASLGVKNILISIAGAVVLSAVMAGCGGGDGAQSSLPGTSKDGGRANAQTIWVPNGLIKNNTAGWAAMPPAFATPGTYTPSGFTGTAYYVDPDGGNNTKDGKSPANAWHDLSQASAKIYEDGDAILLKCGGVWREKLQLNGTGRPNYKNLLVGAYQAPNGPACADNSRPVIRGTRYVSSAGWTPVASGSAVLKLNVTGPVGHLFKDIQPLMKARYPNPQGDNNRFVFADVTGALTAGDTNEQKITKKKAGFRVRATELAFLQGKDVEGATVYIRTVPYMLETATVQSFNTTTGEITLTQPLRFTAENNVGYILEGKSWMVDTEGEWWYSGGASGELRYQPAGGSTAGLEAAYIDTGLQVYNVPGLRVERIRFELQEGNGLDANTVTNLVVNDVESVHAWNYGLYAQASPGAVFTNNRVDGAGYFGIVGNASDGVSIAGNFVTRSGMSRIGGVPGTKAQGGGGIRLQISPNGHIENNYVYQVANGGISFDNKDGVVVANNTVIQPCVLLTDCGGIYTSDGDAVVAGTAIRSVVHHNIVAGVQSNLNGTHLYGINGNAVAGKDQGIGIYLDDHSSWVKAHDNTVSGVEVGFFIHNGANNVIESNTVRAATHASVVVSFDEAPSVADPVRNNLIKGNTFFSHRRVDATKFANNTVSESIDGEHAYAQLWAHRDGATAFFIDNASGARNRSENNQTYTLSKVESPTVWRKVGTRLEQASGAAWALNTGGQVSTLGLSEWRALNQSTALTQDTESSPVSFKPFTYTPGGSLIGNGTFESNGGNWVANGVEFEYTSGAVCGGEAKCGRVKGSAVGYTLVSSPFSLTAPGVYLASYTMAAGPDGGGQDALVRLNASPYTLQGSYVPGSTWASNEVRRIEYFFQASFTAGNAVLALRPNNSQDTSGPGGTNGTLNKNVYFGRAAVQSVSNVQALPAFGTLGVNVINATTAQQTFGCTTVGIQSTNCALVVDEANLPVSFPFTVPARSAKQLYVRHADWAQ